MHSFKPSAHFSSPFWIPFLSSPDIFNESHNPHGWRLETRKQTFLLGDMFSLDTCEYFMAVPFSNTSVCSAALGKMAWRDGRGKASSLKRPVGCQGKLNALSTSSTWVELCLRVKRERPCCLFSYWLLFPASSSQGFSLCQARLVRRGTLNLPQ